MLLRRAVLRNPAVKLILPESGVVKSSSNAKAKRILGPGSPFRRNNSASYRTARDIRPIEREGF
jgi:hypothetical protein